MPLYFLEWQDLTEKEVAAGRTEPRASTCCEVIVLQLKHINPQFLEVDSLFKTFFFLVPKPILH